jgi:hypothetical protein
LHCAPGEALAERFGGYDKLEKLYSLATKTVEQGVDVVFDLIQQSHQFIGGVGETPAWMLTRNDDGRIFVGAADCQELELVRLTSV